MEELVLDLNRLKAERIAKGLTQSQLASKLGMGRASYSKRETGRTDLSITEFGKIVEALGYSKDNVSLFFTVKVPKRKHKSKKKKK